MKAVILMASTITQESSLMPRISSTRPQVTMEPKTIACTVHLTPLQHAWLQEAPLLKGVPVEKVIQDAVDEALQPPAGWSPAAERGRSRSLRLITQEDR